MTTINNSYVMSCSETVLFALAMAIGMTEEQIKKANRKHNLRQHVGTRFDNSATLSAAFADGTLDSAQLGSAVDAIIAQEQEAAVAAASDAMYAEADAMNAVHDAKVKASASKNKNVKSAKTWLRELLSTGNEYTLAELIALTGKTEVNIRTMLSDLRSVKYCGKGGVFATKSVRKDGKVYYSMA